MMVENFADYPKSVTEVHAEKSEDMSKWTPRDALIDLLREIDSGRLKINILFVAAGRIDGTATDTYFRAAGPNHYAVAGCLRRAEFQFQHS